MWSISTKYDYKKTKNEVEKILINYKELKLKLNNVPYYSSSQLKFIYAEKNNNDKVSSIGDYEMKKIEQERKEYYRIINAYEKLYEEDQNIIGSLYFKTRRGCTNDELMYELGLSRTSFYDLKKEAIINFGIALGVAIEK